jgi:hypothetical protein
MNYSINKFLDRGECNSIIEFAEKNGKPFSYSPTKVWDCKRIYDNDFNDTIISKLKNNYKNNNFRLWFDLNEFEINDVVISLTKYYEGRRLDLHLDASSQFTTVIVLSDNFEDGRFVLSNKLTNINNCEKYHLNIGESISFDGSETYHGVMPVTSGLRYALNIWMTNTDYKFISIKNGKSII